MQAPSPDVAEYPEQDEIASFMHSIDVNELHSGPSPAVFDLFKDPVIPQLIIATFQDLQSRNFIHGWKDVNNATLLMGLHDRIVKNQSLPQATSSDQDKELQMLTERYFQIQHEVQTGQRQLDSRGIFGDLWKTATSKLLGWTVSLACEGAGQKDSASELQKAASVGCETAVALSVPEAEALTLMTTAFQKIVLRKTGNPGDLTYATCSAAIGKVLNAACSKFAGGVLRMGNDKGGWELSTEEVKS